MLTTNSISIDYQIQFKAPFHFGTGLRNGLINRSIARNAEQYLYVPGSTLKGVLRDRCEQLARLFNLEAHEPHEETLSEAHPILDIVTRIFGSRFYPGQLYFDDAQLMGTQQAWFEPNPQGQQIDDLRRGEFRAWQTENRTQVSLSRLLGTAKQGHLYSSEYGVRTLCFTGRIIGRLTGFAFSDEAQGNYALLLLVAAIQSLDDDAVGGNKSTGSGRMSLEITKLQVAGMPMDIPKLLEQLDNLEYYQLEKEEGGT